MFGTRVWALFLIAFGLGSGALKAQSVPLSVSARVGFIQAGGARVSEAGLALYPEVQLEAALGTLAEGAIAARAALYGGFWHTSAAEATRRCATCAVAGYRGYQAGARLRLAAHRGSFPLVLSAGVARQMVAVEEVGVWTDQGPAADQRSHFTLAELGLGVDFALSDGWRVQGEALGFLPVAAHENNPLNTGRYALLFGVAYVL